MKGQETEAFKTSPSEYLRVVLRVRRQWLLWLSVAIIATALILTLSDIRWVFVGLIFLFLILPMVLFNAYFFYLLTPEATRAVMLKSVTFSDDGSVAIRYFDKDEDGVCQYSGKTEIIHDIMIKEIDIGDKNIIIFLRKGRPGFIIVPKEAVDEGTINELTDKYKGNRHYNKEK